MKPSGRLVVLEVEQRGAVIDLFAGAEQLCRKALQLRPVRERHRLATLGERRLELLDERSRRIVTGDHRVVGGGHDAPEVAQIEFVDLILRRLGAVALVVWGMPDYVPEPSAENGDRVVQFQG